VYLPSCVDQILEREISSSKTSIVTPPDLAAPVEVDSNWVVKPIDNSLHQSYSFYVKLTTLGGFEKYFPTSGAYTLNVGCLSTSMTSTPSVSFTNSANVFVGDALTNFYTFSPPSANQSYCSPVLNEAVDASGNPSAKVSDCAS
jgi:hypothetical protein